LRAKRKRPKCSLANKKRQKTNPDSKQEIKGGWEYGCSCAVVDCLTALASLFVTVGWAKESTENKRYGVADDDDNDDFDVKHMWQICSEFAMVDTVGTVMRRRRRSTWMKNEQRQPSDWIPPDSWKNKFL
jgi:hypothetical protein